MEMHKNSVNNIHIVIQWSKKQQDSAQTDYEYYLCILNILTWYEKNKDEMKKCAAVHRIMHGCCLWRIQ